MKIKIIDTNNLKKLSKTADGIFLKPEAEKTLISLLQYRNELDKAIDEAKEVIEAAALKLDPHFSSLTADNIKIYYRSFGSRWLPDMALLDYLPKEYYTTVTKIQLDAKKIEKHIKDTGKVPAGVTEVERPKTITFSLKGEVTDNE
ncbi:MAG: hypothetical protein WA019_03505 [Candidatus Moraniibacteriota bacterium]